MVMERLEATAKHSGNQSPEKQLAIRQARELLVVAGVTDPGPKVEKIQKINLDLEWQRQSERYVELGFHAELGLSAEDYLASLPKFEPQPENFCGRFDISVLVETRILPSRQAELAGLPYFLTGLNARDWSKDPKGYKTPDSPYTTWMQDGKRNLGKSVKNVRETLEATERGATEYDGVALWVANPSILNTFSIDLPGTQVGSGSAPFLYQWDSKPRVDYYLVDYADPRFGSASCGRVAA